MPRRRKSNRIQIVLLAVALFVFLLMGVAPLVEFALPIDSRIAGWLEWSRSRVMEAMVALWFFAFGSMVGSFINVVVWRMPRGVSVVSSGSACPWCCTKIRLKDNIPIFGWIKLRGRCRACRLPISARYPIVEAIFGLVFLLMFVVELQSACANLPGGKRYLSTGILQVILSTKWDVILTYAWHMILLVMLLTWSLMAWDKSRIPAKTVAFAISLGFLLSFCFPYLHPVKWIGSYDQWLTDLPWIQKLSTGFIGLVVGMFLGSILEAILNRKDHTGQQSIAVSISMMTIGLFNGWQFAMLATGGLGIVLSLAAMRSSQIRLPASAWLAGTTTLLLCSWYWFDKALEPLNDSLAALVLSGIAIGGMVLTGSSGRRSSAEPTAPETPEEKTRE